ncbi:MAG TPA: MDR family MFS transporter [Chloroflexia bacterium]|nr:MDR family MFS transporter [Chloroflexia bacterium]
MEAGLVDDVIEGAQVATPVSEGRSIALNRPLIIIALMLATALSALDGTIVSTALPSIVGALGGLPLYSLVVSAFLLTSTTTVPLYGKLADIYGRKPVFMLGSGIFIVGSALCGLAWDMPSLIAFRALQGVGAGAIVPVSLTLVGDLFDMEERARLQGVFSSVWGVSSVIGPLVGGAIVQFADWRWVFFINLPIGIFASWLFFRYLREPHIHVRQKVDWAGGVTLTLGSGLALMALQSGGHGGEWLAPTTLLLWGGAALLLALFVLVERRAAAPVLSLGLLSRPVIAVPCLVGLVSGGVLMGVTAYVPLLAQGGWGSTPIEAGLVIAPLSIGWPLASTLSARLIIRFGYRAMTLTGTILILIGSLLLLTIQAQAVSENLLLRGLVTLISAFIIGAGLGLSTSTMLIAVQSSVGWRERGIATAAVQFFRNMGQAAGAAVLGVILVVTLVPVLATERMQRLVAQLPPEAGKAGADPALGPVNSLFDLAVREMLPVETRAALADALAGSLWWVFFGSALIALAGALMSTRFPRVVPYEEK